jgi:hypothetical protein
MSIFFITIMVAYAIMLVVILMVFHRMRDRNINEGNATAKRKHGRTQDVLKKAS